MSENRAQPHEEYTHRILAEIEKGSASSQRSLAGSVGIALGLTNLLLKRLVRKGFVRVSLIKRNRVAYFLTPTGIAEKARMSRNALQNSVQFYAHARDRIRQSFVALAEDWPPAAGDGRKRIVFFGSGELAEIAYVCLQETDFELVGVIDDQGRQRFFDIPIYSADALRAGGLDGMAFDRLVVMSFRETDRIRGALHEAGVRPEQVFWI